MSRIILEGNITPELRTSQFPSSVLNVQLYTSKDLNVLLDSCNKLHLYFGTKESSQVNIKTLVSVAALRKCFSIEHRYGTNLQWDIMEKVTVTLSSQEEAFIRNCKGLPDCELDFTKAMNIQWVRDGKVSFCLHGDEYQCTEQDSELVLYNFHLKNASEQSSRVIRFSEIPSVLKGFYIHDCSGEVTLAIDSLPQDLDFLEIFDVSGFRIESSIEASTLPKCLPWIKIGGIEKLSVIKQMFPFLFDRRHVLHVSLAKFAFRIVGSGYKILTKNYLDTILNDAFESKGWHHREYDQSEGVWIEIKTKP